jgi:hypothetical protein
MAQATFTPIKLYYSSNAGATPSTTNLAAGELAINTADGKLFYKDNNGALQVIAQKSTATTPFSVSIGGTGISSLTQGGVAYGGATTYAFSAVGTSGDVLKSNGTGAPTWITPASANTPSALVIRNASGNFSAGTITADLTGTASTSTNLSGGTVGAVPYQSAIGTTSFLAAGSSGTVLTMSSGGVPEWTTAGTSTLASNLAGGTAGALAYQSAPNATSFLAAGTSGQVLTLTSGQIPAWGTLNAPTSVANITGGAAGSVPYQTAASTTAFLSAGTSGQVLTLTSGQLPSWQTPSSVTSVANITGGNTNTIAVQTSANNTGFITAPSGSSYLNYTGSAFQWSNPVTSVSAGTGMSFSTITSSGSVGIDTAVVPRFANAGTFTATQTFSGSSSAASLALNNALETCTINAGAASGSINIDVATQSVVYYTANASSTWTVNIRASSGTTLNSFMAAQQSVTVALLVQTGATTGAYPTAITVDGAAPALVKWLGGTAPTAGNASSIDVYSFTVIKIGTSTYTVLASQAKFA